MKDDQREKIKIDGSSIELDAYWANKERKSGLFEFLSEHTRHHPWIVGIAAICSSAVMVPADSVGSTITSCMAVLSIAVITVLAMRRKECACKESDKPSSI